MTNLIRFHGIKGEFKFFLFGFWTVLQSSVNSESPKVSYKKLLSIWHFFSFFNQLLRSQNLFSRDRQALLATVTILKKKLRLPKLWVFSRINAKIPKIRKNSEEQGVSFTEKVNLRIRHEKNYWIEWKLN